MNYQKYYDKAFKKVKEKGSPIIITGTGESEYNPETDEYDGTEIEITGVALQFNFDQKDIDGTNIKFSDVRFMAVLNGKPQTNYSVTFGNQTYTIINAKPLNLDGVTDIYWTIQAR